MYDKLVKALRDMSKMGMKYGMAVVKMREAADAIEELQKTVNFHKFNSEFWEDKYNSLADEKWIPVTEQPPLKVGDEGYTGYLVFANGYYEIADYTIDKFDNVPYFHVDGEYNPDVTHWMELPAPPMEDENNV